MAGINKDTPVPIEIKLHKVSNKLELAYASGERHELSAEFLRVFTPSAEARGHGPGQETLQTGKRTVEISRIEPVGTYAICIHFSDGHNSGLYSWDLLHNFGLHHDELWAEYLKQLTAEGGSRDFDTTAKFNSGGNCGQRH
jgi:DUF971 family protein